jgi:hypothetical protein
MGETKQKAATPGIANALIRVNGKIVSKTFNFH